MAGLTGFRYCDDCEKGEPHPNLHSIGGHSPATAAARVQVAAAQLIAAGLGQATRARVEVRWAQAPRAGCGPLW